MAQSTSFFGLRKGSTKSLTFQTYRGKQITKDRVSDVANPQTTKQMQQRLKLPLVANFVAIWKGLLNHSFEGTEYGYQSIAKARALNLAKNSLNIDSYVPKGTMMSGVADFIVSKGSLTPVKIVFGGDNGNFILDGSSTNNLYEGDAAPTKDSALTEEQLSYIVSLLPSNCQNVDQLTFMVAHIPEYTTYTTPAGTNRPIALIEYGVSRLVLDTTRFDENSGWTWDGQGNLSDGVTTLVSQSDFGIAVCADAPDVKADGLAVIASAKENDNWKRSSQRMIFRELDHVISFDDAEPTYLSSQATSNKYLNTGTDSVGVKGSQLLSAISNGSV